MNIPRLTIQITRDLAPYRLHKLKPLDIEQSKKLHPSLSLEGHTKIKPTDCIHIYCILGKCKFISFRNRKTMRASNYPKHLKSDHTAITSLNNYNGTMLIVSHWDTNDNQTDYVKEYQLIQILHRDQYRYIRQNPKHGTFTRNEPKYVLGATQRIQVNHEQKTEEKTDLNDHERMIVIENKIDQLLIYHKQQTFIQQNIAQNKKKRILI